MTKAKTKHWYVCTKCGDTGWTQRKIGLSCQASHPLLPMVWCGQNASGLKRANQLSKGIKKLAKEAKPKTTRNMHYHEFQDWATSYLLEELIRGKFRDGVGMVLGQVLQNEEFGGKKQ